VWPRKWRQQLIKVTGKRKQSANCIVVDQDSLTITSSFCRSLKQFTVLCATRLCSGAKLAPFNSGGVCQNCPAKTDDALQQIFISGHYFPQ
jgi:hypothetical protein